MVLHMICWEQLSMIPKTLQLLEFFVWCSNLWRVHYGDSSKVLDIFWGRMSTCIHLFSTLIRLQQMNVFQVTFFLRTQVLLHLQWMRMIKLWVNLHLLSCEAPPPKAYYNLLLYFAWLPLTVKNAYSLVSTSPKKPLKKLCRLFFNPFQHLGRPICLHFAKLLLFPQTNFHSSQFRMTNFYFVLSIRHWLCNLYMIRA